MKHTLFDERRKLRTRRVAGIPISVLAILAVSITALAAIAYLGPFSAPVSQTTKSIYAVTGSAAEPAYGGIEPTLGDLRAYCEGRLASFKHPRRLAIVGKIPRTQATGQAQRRLLVEMIA